MSQSMDAPGPVRPGQELDEAALTACFRRHFGQDASIHIAQYPRGYSNQTYLIQYGDRELVLRTPPSGTTVASAHDMHREYTILSKLSPTFALAPKPYFYAAAGEVLDLSFYVMEKREGVILRDNKPPDFSADAARVRDYCRGFVQGLAQLHGLDYAAMGLESFRRPGSFVARQVEGWSRRYEKARTESIPAIDRAMPWLAQHCPEDVDAVLIHNDYKFDNMLLDSDDLSRIGGILDWELSTIGDPLIDLGVTLSYWNEAQDPPGMLSCFLTLEPGAMTRQEVAESYARLTQRDISNLLFYYVFALFRWAVNVQQIYYRYVTGVTQDPRFAAFGEVLQWIGLRLEIALDTEAV